MLARSGRYDEISARSAELRAATSDPYRWWAPTAFAWCFLRASTVKDFVASPAAYSRVSCSSPTSRTLLVALTLAMIVHLPALIARTLEGVPPWDGFWLAQACRPTG